jgi:hypothetical protein
MIRPLPNYFTSSMSIEQVLGAVDESLENWRPPSPREGEVPTTVEDLSDELRVWLADAERFYTEAPERGWGALAIADLAAGLRDRERREDGDYRGISHHADLIGHWLVARAEQPTLSESLHVARLAAAGEPWGSDLPLDLADLLAGRAHGSISDDQFGRIIKKPKRGGRRPKPRRRKPVAVPPGSLTVSGAGEALQQVLDQLPAGAGFAEVWETFNRFVARRVYGDAPERVVPTEELMLFECGPGLDTTQGASPGSYAGLLRQLAVEDEDGDPDRLEELRCEVLFGSEQVSFAEHEAIWSDDDVDTWRVRVESTEVFKALIAAGAPLALSVDQSWR